MTLKLSPDFSHDISPIIYSKSNIIRNFSFITKYTHHQLLENSKVKNAIDHASTKNKFT